MTPFQQMFDGLQRVALSSRHKHRFKDARGRHPVLAVHSSIATVLAALELDGRDAYAEKETLTRALIAAQQASPSSFWAAVLLVAYYPMLSRLRNRIYGDPLPDEDLDQLVVTGFLSVVAEFPLADRQDRTAMYLRQMTQRLVFRWVRQELREQKVVLLAEPERIDKLLDEAAPPDRDPSSPGRQAHLIDEGSVRTLIVTRFGDVVDRGKLDLVLTLVQGEQLNRHVERLYPDTPPDERERIYQRLKRQRKRTIKELREEISNSPCPFFRPERLCPSRSETSNLMSGSAQ